ncbi:hypothetical protein BK704_19580 [[Bacillus thuringiensis] serovar konkukian]|nr:hypothetical protein BK704_19580 [[Bacillus thuringiensis] serovar konkukian]
MTDSLHPNPLMCQNVHRFGLPTGEGAPSKSEGVGGFWDGVWGNVPQWVWATPKVCFCDNAS